MEMKDRETVIEALQYMISGDCTETQFDYTDDIEAAITMLKEQKAVKPYIDIDEAKCPICKVKLTRQELLGEDVLFEDFFDYCPRCGRKVKWE